MNRGVSASSDIERYISISCWWWTVFFSLETAERWMTMYLGRPRSVSKSQQCLKCNLWEQPRAGSFRFPSLKSITGKGQLHFPTLLLSKTVCLFNNTCTKRLRNIAESRCKIHTVVFQFYRSLWLGKCYSVNLCFLDFLNKDLTSLRNGLRWGCGVHSECKLNCMGLCSLWLG